MKMMWMLAVAPLMLFAAASPSFAEHRHLHKRVIRVTNNPNYYNGYNGYGGGYSYGGFDAPNIPPGLYTAPAFGYNQGYSGYFNGPSYGGGFGPGYGQNIYHDTSHYDYHPGYYVPHGNHLDYVPGHYDYHQTGHYDTYYYR